MKSDARQKIDQKPFSNGIPLYFPWYLVNLMQLSKIHETTLKKWQMEGSLNGSIVSTLRESSACSSASYVSNRCDKYHRSLSIYKKIIAYIHICIWIRAMWKVDRGFNCSNPLEFANWSWASWAFISSFNGEKCEPCFNYQLEQQSW